MTKRLVVRFLLLCLACSLLLPLAVSAMDTENMEPPRALSRHSLGNFTFSCGLDNDLILPLRNGAYTSPSHLQGETINANLVEAAWGDIQGAGEINIAAAVVYVYSTGGSGNFYQLSLLGVCLQQPCELACEPLGDRIQLLELDINNSGEIVAKLVVHGENDPACCPTKHVTRTWTYTSKNEEQGELQAK